MNPVEPASRDSSAHGRLAQPRFMQLGRCDRPVLPGGDPSDLPVRGAKPSHTDAKPPGGGRAPGRAQE
jgi:hypothetical protein